MDNCINICDVYESKNESDCIVLAIKVHNWFLPTEGMLGRLYRHTKVAKTESEGNVLAPATDRNLFVVPASSVYWSCTEL